MKKVFARIGIFIGVVVAGLWIWNTSLFSSSQNSHIEVIAHRGLAQDFDRRGLTNETCTAARMIPTGHSYLENTLDSMAAAIDLGADVIEFDIHQTTDDHFAVTHDWTLDCRTDGSGVTREHSLAELKQLDVGYGYTADNGQTFPFRGQGIGLMPSMQEVFAAFPEANFLIDIKSNDPEEGRLLAQKLGALLPQHQGQVMVYGGPLPVSEVLSIFPELRSITRPRLIECLKKYIALGWSGYVPPACENSLLLIPANVAPWLWGWPSKFEARMDKAGSSVAIIGDYTGVSYTTGFDDPERISDLGSDYSGAIWTDRIDVMGPAVKGEPVSGQEP